MIKKLDSLIVYLLWILFFLLPIIHSQIFHNFWIDFWFAVEWNYEFTKVMFFNVFSSIIFVLFAFKSLFSKEKKIIPPLLVLWIVIFFIILWLSTYFSISPYVSLFWSILKWHWVIMFISLIWLLIVLLNQKHENIKKIVLFLISWAVFASIIAIKEFIFPNLEYWDLSSRAIWTMWHPNYLALVLLMTIPLIYNSLNRWTSIYTIQDYLKYIWLFIIIIAIFLTKSLFWILIFILYNFYFISISSENSNSKLSEYAREFRIIFVVFIIVFVWLAFLIFPEKLSSFLSRFYIWSSTIKIILSDYQILIFWWWADTLNLIFDKYKDVNLYIFENIWFTADRPHNFIINIFYHFWVLWLAFILYTIVILEKIFKNLKFTFNDNFYYFQAVIIFFLFTVFNYPSIVSYCILILYIAIILREVFKDEYYEDIEITKYLIIIILFFSSIFSILYSSKYYVSEVKAKSNQYISAKDIFPYNYMNYYELWEIDKWLEIQKYKWEIYHLAFIYKTWDIDTYCDKLLYDYPTPENYFYCWNVNYKLWKKDLAIIYYNLWLSKLPDLRNPDSKYYKSLFYSTFVSTHRFFSTKYSNIQEILRIIYDK